jgi:hypothetical protein
MCSCHALNLNKILFIMDKKDIIEVANSFKTYEEMYELLNNGDFSFLSRELGTNRYPQIEWIIEYFENKEEYEKCEFLSKLQISN